MEFRLVVASKKEENTKIKTKKTKEKGESEDLKKRHCEDLVTTSFDSLTTQTHVQSGAKD